MERTVEILQYTLLKGTGTIFHIIMREIGVPLHQCHGIGVVSFGNLLHDSDCYYLIRAFNNQESMTVVLDSFYASTGWRNGSRQDIIGGIGASIKTVINLPLESVDGLRVQS